MANRSRKRSTKPIQTQAVVAGSTLRFEEPKSKRKPKPNVAVVMAHEINPVGGFVNFLREYAVVGVAVGFAIGLQAQTLIKQLVSSFVTPLFTLVFGEDLNTRVIHLTFNGRTEAITWGAFAYSLLDFMFVLAAIYFFIKIFKLDKFDQPKKK